MSEQEIRDPALISPAGWAALADAGETTFEVPAELLSRNPAGSLVFADRATAEREADARHGTYFEWTGRSARMVRTPQYEADYDIWCEAS